MFSIFLVNIFQNRDARITITLPDVQNQDNIPNSTEKKNNRYKCDELSTQPEVSLENYSGLKDKVNKSVHKRSLKTKKNKRNKKTNGRINCCKSKSFIEKSTNLKNAADIRENLTDPPQRRFIPQGI